MYMEKLEKEVLGLDPMLDNEKLKTRSYRVTEAMEQKIKDITDELGDGYSQKDAFLKMIAAYELQRAKGVFGEDAKIIEEIESYTNMIMKSFLVQVENKQHLEKTIGAKYDSLLVSKDQVIQELQQRMAMLSEEKKNAEQENETTQELYGQLLTKNEELDKQVRAQKLDFEEKLSDKSSLNDSLQETCKELRAKMDAMKEMVEQAQGVLEEKKQLDEQNQKLERQVSDLNRQILQEKEIVKEEAIRREEAVRLVEEKSKLEHEKKILEINQAYMQEMEELKKKSQAEIDRYQEKYRQLLDQISVGK